MKTNGRFDTTEIGASCRSPSLTKESSHAQTPRHRALPVNGVILPITWAQSMFNDMPRTKLQRSRVSPFVPGTGGTPPLLAGRDVEQAQLDRLCKPLTQGRGAPRPAVLVGPRGNGKTVLLHWLETEAEEAGIETTWLTPDEIPTLEALAARVRKSKGSRPRVRQVSVGGYTSCLTTQPHQPTNGRRHVRATFRYVSNAQGANRSSSGRDRTV